MIASLGADALPGVDEVVGDDLLAVAPAHALAQAEQVLEPVVGDAHVVRHRRDDVQLAVDLEEALEEVVDELAALGRVRVAGRDLVRRQRRGLDAGGQLVARGASSTRQQNASS